MQQKADSLFAFDSYRYLLKIMFNFKKLFAALVIALTGIAGVQASEFAGPYAGIKLGENWSDASGVVNTASHASTFFGLTAGYNFDVKNFVIGAEGFADLHNGSTTYKDAGVDAKLGLPMNNLMPYARLGFTAHGRIRACTPAWDSNTNSRNISAWLVNGPRIQATMTARSAAITA
jgi:hypothetical protein